MHQPSCALFLAMLAWLSVAWPASAANYYWGGDGINPGGAGTWSQTNARWGTNTGGPFTATQNDVGVVSNVNVFEGPSGGLVTVSGTVDVRWMTFNTPGYTLTGGTITRTNSTGFLVDGSADVTINSDIVLPSGSRLGMSGTKTLTLNGTNDRGTNVNSGTVIAGSSARIGIVILSNGASLVLNSGNDGNLRLANGTSAQFTFSAGGTLASSNAGGIDISNTVLSSAGTFNFGNSTYTGLITFTQNLASTGARTLNVATNTPVTFSGNLSGSGGSYTKVGAGTLTLSGNNTFSGGVNLGVISTVAGQLNINSATALGSGTFTIAGGTTGAVIDNTSGAAITVSNNNPFVIGSSFTFIGTNDLNLGTGAVNKGSADKTISVANAGATLTIGGNFGATPGVLEKAGAGTLVLSGNNAYTGGTTVSAGTLLANNMTGSATGTGNVIVNGGTFGGTGAISGTITVNSAGTLAPGASIESLSGGTLTHNNGSTFAYEINSSAPLGVGADLQVVNGDLNLNGTVMLTLDDLAGSPAAFDLGTTFSLISYSGAWNGGLFTLGGNVLADGGQFRVGRNTWQIFYDASSGGSNFVGDQLSNGSFVNITAVPEPRTCVLWVLGVIAMAAIAAQHSCRQSTKRKATSVAPRTK
jgi:autotransporter-associated beta strand protein